MTPYRRLAERPDPPPPPEEGTPEADVLENKIRGQYRAERTVFSIVGVAGPACFLALVLSALIALVFQQEHDCEKAGDGTGLMLTFV